MNKLINISELSRILNLTHPKTKKPLNHVLRFWEKKFKQIRPKIINNRRYYSPEQVEIMKKIKFLLKTKKMTIFGARNLLNDKINKLDDYNISSLDTNYYKNLLKTKGKIILKKLNSIKVYGKKNTS
jgi:DNA-binding transcriptional MerR regulator